MVNIFKKWIPEQMTFALPASIRNMIENHLVGPTASTVLALNGQARFSPKCCCHTPEGRSSRPLRLRPIAHKCVCGGDEQSGPRARGVCGWAA